MVNATRTGRPTGFMTRSPGTEPSAQPRWENTAGFIMPDLGTGCQDGEWHSILLALTPLYCWSEKNLANTGTTRSCWNLQPGPLNDKPSPCHSCCSCLISVLPPPGLLLNSAPGKGSNQQDIPFHQVCQSWSHNHSHLSFLKTPVSTGALRTIATGSSQLSSTICHLSPSCELGPCSPGCTVEALG